MKRSQAALSVAVAADAVGLAIYFALRPFLFNRFTVRFEQNLELTSIINALIMAGFFILFLVGVGMVMKMQPAPTAPFPWLQSRTVRGVLAGVCAVLLALALADLAGYIDSSELVEFGEMGNATYLLFSGGIFFFFPLIYLLIVATDVTSTIESTDTVRQLVSLVLQNVMIAATGIYLAALWQRTDRLEAGPAIALSLLFLLAAFLMPRLLLVNRTRQRWAIAPLLIALLTYAVLAGVG
jgi:hypothetical protein